jgi:hypothetical protein
MAGTLPIGLIALRWPKPLRIKSAPLPPPAQSDGLRRIGGRERMMSYGRFEDVVNALEGAALGDSASSLFEDLQPTSA